MSVPTRLPLSTQAGYGKAPCDKPSVYRHSLTTRIYLHPTIITLVNLIINYYKCKSLCVGVFGITHRLLFTQKY